MADEIDMAQECEAAERAAALSRVVCRSGIRGLGPEWIDGRPCCRDCGEEIPSRRLAAVPGCERCRACQEAAEAQ